MIGMLLWAMSGGLTMIGVGLSLFYQGQAFKKATSTYAIGVGSFRTGIAWAIMGGILFFVGGLLFIMNLSSPRPLP